MREDLIITPENHLALERTIELLSHSLREIRQVALQMIPESILKSGLDASLKVFFDQLKKPDSLHVIYESFGLDNALLEPVVAASVFHIVEELVHNTIHHAAASKLMVLVTCRDGRVTIAVEDNGRGFDTAVLQQRGRGWSFILDQTESIHGKVETQSAPGKGTAVRVVVRGQSESREDRKPES